MQPITTAKTIPEARNTLIARAIMCGYIQIIQHGSFENEFYRIQLPDVSVRITNHTFDRVPVPPTADWPKEMTTKHGEAYYQKYILGSVKPDKRTEYTYAERINEDNQLFKVMEMLRVSPQTNQAVIEVGRHYDVDSSDPACLRGIQFIYDGEKLNIFVWFRSHDIFAGLPENFYGLSRLLEDVAEYADLPCGDFCYHGSASHVYSYQLDFLDY